MLTETIPFDAAQYIESAEGHSELLHDAFESGDAGYIAAALGVVARAKGMTQVAKDAGVTREALYKALSAEGDPKLSTLLGVVRALGVHLSVSSAQS
ncbi:addiction module antidote protein [Pararhizobium sp.]|uniref:addiction module antidote protein n=1 Tax=Pararhizobium sp. TaxID=1977563 RepID=UPI002725B5FA|nr:addiction module antidote protein [Pararhizobium sp.]MDO9414906.1 putative addiction module antidote protein [Pararhizobium sp.]